MQQVTLMALVSVLLSLCTTASPGECANGSPEVPSFAILTDGAPLVMYLRSHLPQWLFGPRHVPQRPVRVLSGLHVL